MSRSHFIIRLLGSNGDCMLKRQHIRFVIEVTGLHFISACLISLLYLPIHAMFGFLEVGLALGGTTALLPLVRPVFWLTSFVFKLCYLPLGPLCYPLRDDALLLALSPLSFRVLNSTLFGCIAYSAMLFWLAAFPEPTASRVTAWLCRESLFPKRLNLAFVRLFSLSKLHIPEKLQIPAWAFIHFSATRAAAFFEVGHMIRSTDTGPTTLFLAIMQFPLVPIITSRSAQNPALGGTMLANSIICGIIIVFVFRAIKALGTPVTVEPQKRISAIVYLACVSVLLSLGFVLCLWLFPLEQRYSSALRLGDRPTSAVSALLSPFR